MDASFIPIAVEPSKTALGLDQIRRSYKTSLSAEAAIAAAPTLGAADETFANMSLTEISTPESAESATRIDLVYTGSMSGDTTLIPIEVVPSKNAFGLDQLRRTYRSFQSAEDALAAAPAIGSADATFPGMFLTQIATPESTQSPTRIDLMYMGILGSVLPASRNSLDNPIQSATTYTSSAIFPAVAASPASVEYHAHSNVIVVISLTSTSSAICPAPAAIVIADLISWTLTTTQPASSFPDIAAWLLSDAFVQAIVEVTSAEEIVPGQYWQVTKRKTMQLFPYAPP